MSTSPILLSLLCLVAAGLLDLIFKLYAGRPRSRGMLIFGIGCIWAALQMVYMIYIGEEVMLDRATLIYGLSAAVLVTISNILLIECMSHLPISMASTIYRLNTIPLVIIAFVFLKEDTSLFKWAGIAMGLVTILLLYRPNDGSATPDRRFVLFIWLIILASCVRALYGIFTKVGVNHGGSPSTMMLFAAIGWCLGGLAYAYFREQQISVARGNLVFIPVAGVLVFSIVWLLTTALTLGDASVVVPLTNMGFVAAFLFSVVLRLEDLTMRKVLAVGCAVMSIVFLTSAA